MNDAKCTKKNSNLGLRGHFVVLDAGEVTPLPLGDMDPKPSSEGHHCCEIGAAGGSRKTGPFPNLVNSIWWGSGQTACHLGFHQTTYSGQSVPAAIL